MSPKDPIDAAVAASNQPAVEQLHQTTVTISSTGRHVVIAHPIDLTDSELLEFVGWAAGPLRIGLAQERTRRAGGRIIVPAGVLPT